MDVRKKEIFDFDWLFYQGDIEDAWRTDYKDNGWRALNLPHDWSIEGPFDIDNPAGGDGAFLPTGIGWYRKHFTIDERHKDKKVSVCFDGAYMNAEVWVNNQYLGKNHFGYMNFSFDISLLLNYGRNNVIAVKIDNSEQPNSRWYSGSGIYRHTWLKITDRLSVTEWGTYITTPVITDKYAQVVIKTRVENLYETDQEAILSTAIIDASNSVVEKCLTDILIPRRTTAEFVQKFNIPAPALWCIENPYQYKAYTDISISGQKKDDYETLFGIRKIRFDSKHGFFLNDKKVKIKGVCLHQDAGCLGVAVPERVWESRLTTLKEMGCNAIRISHNPPAPEFMNLLDKMGFMAMSEAFDEWTICKNKNGIIGTYVDGGAEVYGYHRLFNEHSKTDLARLIHRDRNHPSVILWSIGNEVLDQREEDGAAIARGLANICHREDPTRPVTAACDLIKAEENATVFETSEEFLNELDVVGYNYSNRWRTRGELYNLEDHIKYPERVIIGSEHSSVTDVRGEFMANRDIYLASLLDAEKLWKFTCIHDYVAGDFIWTGIDYLGEARLPDKSWKASPIDMCGFKKDSFYFYQSQWTKKPMLHIFPHWNFEGRESEIITVMCFSNCETVELFLNGKSYGQKCYQFPRYGMAGRWMNYEPELLPITTSDLHLSWDVPYQAGTLKAVGKTKGEIVCVRELATTEKAARIELEPDRKVICADGMDVSLVTVKVTDAAGNIIPDANHLITFEIEGEGMLIGVDNGKPDSFEDFKVNFRKAFNGLCIAVIQATRTPGEIKITADSEGIDAAAIIIVSK